MQPNWYVGLAYVYAESSRDDICSQGNFFKKGKKTNVNLIQNNMTNGEIKVGNDTNFRFFDEDVDHHVNGKEGPGKA